MRAALLDEGRRAFLLVRVPEGRVQRATLEQQALVERPLEGAAGSVESMSRAPFVVAKAESPYSRDFKVFDTSIGARFPNPKIVDQFGNDSMPETGDNVAAEFGISREDSDRFAAASQINYAAAKEAGFYAGEILPISVPTGRRP